MSLNTLAAAASFVEAQSNKSEVDTRENSSKRLISSPTSDSDCEKDKRRPGGAGTREIHNRLEKNRRAHLKVCFETLKKEIPTLDDKRTSNLSILKSALRYIENLEKKAKEVTKEKEELKKHNLSLRERLRTLRNEIKVLLDASTDMKQDISKASVSCLPSPEKADAAVNNKLPEPVAMAILPSNPKSPSTCEDEEVYVDDDLES